MRGSIGKWIAVTLALGAGAAVAQQDKPIYKCPGNAYTDQLSAKEAETQGCKRLEGAAVTVIQSVPPTRRPGNDSAASRPADSKVDPADQKARDADKRRILETELRREEERLAGLKTEYANGTPERRGDERNYQKYLDRVAEMKAAVERSEADVAALKRELAKLPPG